MTESPYLTLKLKKEARTEDWNGTMSSLYSTFKMRIEVAS